MSALLASPMIALAVTGLAEGAQVDTMVGIRKANPVTPEALDSPAQTAIKRLAAPAAETPPIRIANTQKIHPDLITRLEEIRVYGRNEPEDFVGPKMSPMLQFRARLERDVRLTPAQKVQAALCLIGLCANYGPEGIPLGDSPERRAEARLVRSTMQLNAVTGTLQ